MVVWANNLVIELTIQLQDCNVSYLLMLQMKVYNDLGKGVLKNAWEGFNTSLFAYGQTGSGKSWSIVGYGANKGKLFGTSAY